MECIANAISCHVLEQIWELGSCKLKLSLTGHISSVRGLAVSSRQPYLFSCGEDKQVKCWDLEMNKVITMTTMLPRGNIVCCRLSVITMVT